MADSLIAERLAQKKEWDTIWGNKLIINKIVNLGRIFYNKRFFTILKKYMNVENFCELGCGSSTFLAMVAPYATKVTGVDYSDISLDRSRNHFNKLNVQNSRFINDNCLKLKTKEKFDVVWSQGLIEHFADPAKILKEHLKITKKGGYAIISVPYTVSYHNLWYKITRPKILNRFWPWTSLVFFSKKSLESCLKKYCSEEKDYKIKTYPLLGVIILFIHKK
ncbi:MAG: class I SAM-dependent methyltransferase [Candidatus Nanoarchaeia archaeon]|jgi:ubiquinone/menaquinone biosynthesis C-methylase UbiE